MGLIVRKSFVKIAILLIVSLFLLQHIVPIAEAADGKVCYKSKSCDLDCSCSGANAKASNCKKCILWWDGNFPVTGDNAKIKNCKSCDCGCKDGKCRSCGGGSPPGFTCTNLTCAEVTDILVGDNMPPAQTYVEVICNRSPSALDGWTNNKLGEGMVRAMVVELNGTQMQCTAIKPGCTVYYKKVTDINQFLVAHPECSDTYSIIYIGFSYPNITHVDNCKGSECKFYCNTGNATTDYREYLLAIEYLEENNLTIEENGTTFNFPQETAKNVTCYILSNSTFRQNGTNHTAPIWPTDYAEVTGMVKDEFGNPLPSARIDVIGRSLEAFGGELFKQTIFSDDNGEYRIVGPGNSSNDIVVSYPGYVTNMTADVGMALGLINSINYTLKRGSERCESDCTYLDDSICHAGCNGIAGCAFFDSETVSVCDGSSPGWINSLPGEGNISVKCCIGAPFESSPVAVVDKKSPSGNIISTMRIVMFHGRLMRMIVDVFN